MGPVIPPKGERHPTAPSSSLLSFIAHYASELNATHSNAFEGVKVAAFITIVSRTFGDLALERATTKSKSKVCI
jgi:hypothetical protein